MKSVKLIPYLRTHGEYAIRALDEDGNDVLQESSVYVPPADKLRKRVNRRILCDETINGLYYSTQQVSCDRRNNAQAYYCNALTADIGEDDDPTVIDRPGTCRSDEICVDGVTVLPYTDTFAFCASIESLVKVVTLLNSNRPTGRRMPVQYWGPKPAENTVEAVFTGNTPTTRAQLMNITMEAQISQVNARTRNPYTTVAREECLDCSSVSINQIPEKTNRWLVNALFGPGTGSSTMYVALA
ncbi:MAG: hypothetical protein Q9164_007180 [Protoblastenia rupestris]